MTQILPSFSRRLSSRRASGPIRIVAALTLAGLVVAGCSSTKKGICPRIAVLAQAGEITQLAADGQIAFRAEITDVRVECEYQTGTMQQMTADIKTRMRVTRGPAMQGDVARLSYFVSVTDRRGNVLNKRVFPVTANTGGRPTAEFSDASWQFYRMTRGGTGLAYEIWIGFQLTEEQLEFNRRKGIE